MNGETNPSPLPRVRPRRRGDRGFTLLELIIVVAVIGILATLALPRMKDVPRRAAEATLKMDLRTIRDALDQYKADTGRYPATLEALAEDGYLRKVPVDPITRSNETWVVEYDEEAEGGEGWAEVDEEGESGPGIVDVRSGAEGTTLNGIPYGEL